VSGIGLVKYAKNIENAEKLINFLLRKDTQQQFALGNYEYPVRPDVAWSPLLKEWGTFNEQEVSMNKLGEYNRTAVTIFDQAGWR
jgi:iron(III) transport system substrate-binding protein